MKIINNTVASGLTITVSATFMSYVTDKNNESDTLVGLVRRQEWSVLKMTEKEWDDKWEFVLGN